MRIQYSRSQPGGLLVMYRGRKGKSQISLSSWSRATWPFSLRGERSGRSWPMGASMRKRIGGRLISE